MKAITHSSTQLNALPLWLKALYSGFMAVLVPVYWANYGPTNFLYFCDVALFVTLIAMWKESSLLASVAAVGIIIPQIFWCVDFGCELFGIHLSGMTSYMFDSHRSLFLRGLSLFHGWLPFLLFLLVSRLGYDKRALFIWTCAAWLLCLISFNFLPPAGAHLANPNLPVNVDYVFGLDDARAQTWMPPTLYLVVWMLALFALLYVPAHLVLKQLYGNRAK